MRAARRRQTEPALPRKGANRKRATQPPTITRRSSLQIGVASAASAALPWSGLVRSADRGEPRFPRIWDGHCHLSSVPGDAPRDRMAKMLEYANRMQIERLVVFMGWPFSMDPSPDELRRQNDQVLEAISAWPDRAFGYAYVSPAHVDASLAEIQRCVADGPMVGLKLWVARKCEVEAMDPIVESATRLQAPIYQHTWLKITGNLPGESTPMELAKLARRHPRAVFLCGHAGGDWEQGIRAIRTCQNVFLEIAGGDPTAGFVEMGVRELGSARVVYGSDAGGRSFASQLAKVESAQISDREKEQILGGNLRKLLSPILAVKGIEV